jgi:plasmid stabilization system protein ParE
VTSRRLEFTRQSHADLAQITSWTDARFGFAQADRYAAHLDRLILGLATDPLPVGSRDVGSLRPGLRSLGSSGLRHVGLYQLTETGAVLILRILHVSMDPSRHLPSDPT